MSATKTNDAPHTVLVHVNCEVPHGVWEDLLEGLYDQYVAEDAAEPTGIALMTREEWEECGCGTFAAANTLGDEIAGAIAVGTDPENTPIMCEAEICIPLAEEV